MINIPTVAEVNRDHRYQIASINKTVNDYKKSKEDYQKSLEKSGQIAQDQIKQALILSDEPNAVMEYHGLGDTGRYVIEERDAGFTNGKSEHIDSKQYLQLGSLGEAPNLNGEFLEVNYTNLKNSYYGDKKISKIKVVFSDGVGFANGLDEGYKFLNLINDKNSKFYLGLHNNPALGLWYTNSVTAQTTLYDENGNEIAFNTEFPNAFINIGSLNSSNNDSESATLQTAVKALSLYGSWTSAAKNADGETIYSKANIDDEYAKITGKDTDKGWDVPYSEYGAYFGSSVFELLSNNYKIKYGVYEYADNKINTLNPEFGGFIWAINSTTIPTTPTPKKSQVSYHFNSS